MYACVLLSVVKRLLKVLLSGGKQRWYFVVGDDMRWQPWEQEVTYAFSVMTCQERWFWNDDVVECSSLIGWGFEGV